MKRRALFLDRDGTLIIDRHYPRIPSEVAFLPGVPEILQPLQDHFLLIVVSNQSGVGRGLITPEEFRAVHNRFEEMLKDEGIELSGSAYCLHAPDAGCRCRKPGTALLEDEAAAHHIDLSESYMIGDKQSDLEAGLASGCRSILLNPEADPSIPLKGDEKKGYTAVNLRQAGEWILSTIRTETGF